MIIQKNKMTAIEVNEEDLRKRLLKIYKAFLENPEDKIVHGNAIDYNRRYGSLEGYTAVSEDIKKAIAGLSVICQYNVHDTSHPAFSNEKLIEIAKKTILDLE